MTRALPERRATELRRQRRMRRVQTIADMRAPRLWFEMFDQAARDLDAEDYFDALLEKFAGVDPAVLRALGADKLPTPPLHRVHLGDRPDAGLRLAEGSEHQLASGVFYARVS